MKSHRSRSSNPESTHLLVNPFRLRFVQKALVAIVDQGTLSAINFITSLVAAWMLPKAHFGAYGFGLSLVFFAQTIQHALLGESQEVLTSSIGGERWKRMVGTMLFVEVLLLVAVVGIILLAAALWPHDPIPTVLLGSALFSATLLPHDFVRRILLARLQVGTTLGLSVSRFIAHFAVLGALLWANELTLFTIYVAGSVGAAVASSIGGLRALRGLGSYIRIHKEEMHDLWAFSRWIILKNLSRYILLNVGYWGVVWMQGFESAAIYSAGYLIVAALYVVGTGWSSFFTPYFAKLFVERPHLFSKRILLSLVGWIVLFGPCTAAIILWPGLLLSLFYGDKFLDATTVAQVWGVVSTMGILTIFFDIVLKSMRRPQEAWAAQLIAMIPPIFLLIPAINAFGVVGALLCVLVQRVLLNLVMGWRVHRLISNHRNQSDNAHRLHETPENENIT